MHKYMQNHNYNKKENDGSIISLISNWLMKMHSNHKCFGVDSLFKVVENISIDYLSLFL